MAVRVYELAKELGTNSKDLLQMLKDMGDFVRSASSTVEAPLARKVRTRFADGSLPSAQRSLSEPMAHGMRRSTERIDRPITPPPKRRNAGHTPRPTTAPVVTKPSLQPVTIGVDLVLKLHPVEVDAVEISHPDHPELRLRVDKVSSESSPYWLSVWISGSVLPVPGPWMTLRKWRLPLSRLASPAQQLPGLGVLQLADENSAGSFSERIVIGLLGGDASTVRLAVEECSQVEANRRYGITVMVHRRHGTGGRKRLPETTCLKCGLPLSDPTSVKIGIGPECRRRLEQDAIRALSSPRSAHRIILGAREPKAWINLIQGRFAGFRKPAQTRTPSDA